MTTVAVRKQRAETFNLTNLNDRKKGGGVGTKLMCMHMKTKKKQLTFKPQLVYIQILLPSPNHIVYE